MTRSNEAHNIAITDEYRWNLLQAKKDEIKLMRAFSYFRDQGIEPVLIKGWAAWRVYPPSKYRISTDIDLTVSPNQYEQAQDLYNVSELRRLNIDLHNGLRHLDTVDWDDLFANSITIDLEGVPIRILRPEDHLRVLCVHWLTDGGAYKERLWDIYYAIENGPAKFDWDRCLGVVSKTRRRWILCVIGLTHKYFGLNIDHLPFADEAKSVPNWLIRAVEREWKSDVRLTPIHVFLHDPKGLMKQIRKRIPPNPIQSTIDMEGSFDAPTRIHYQIGSVLKRLGPSIRRVSTTLFRFGK